MHSPFFPARLLSFARVRGAASHLSQFAARLRKKLAGVRASHDRSIRDDEPGPRFQLSYIEDKDSYGVETVGFAPFWNPDAWILESYERIVFYIVAPFSSRLLDEFAATFCRYSSRRVTIQADWTKDDRQTRGQVPIAIDRDGDADLATVTSIWAIGMSRDDMLRERMERVCRAWHLEELAQVEHNANGFRILPSQVTNSSLRVETWHKGVKSSDPEPPYPSQIRLTGFDDAPNAVAYGRAAIAAQPEPPSVLQFMLVALPADVEQIVEVARKIRPIWNGWRFSAERREGFDPFALRRTIGPSEVEACPVVQLDNDGDQLFVRALVVHTHNDTFLELQTSEGRHWLEKAAEFGGGDIEVWDGPFEKRWGMYPATDTELCPLVDPFHKDI